MKFDFVYLGQTVLKYEVPLEIFVGLNELYEQQKEQLPKANKQLVIISQKNCNPPTFKCIKPKNCHISSREADTDLFYHSFSPLIHTQSGSIQLIDFKMSLKVSIL